MVAQHSTKRLFQTYVGKHISEHGRIIFGRWLKSETNQQEKEKELHQLWLDTKGEVTTETQEDWLLLHKRIHKSSLQKFYIQWIKYAAIIVLLILSSVYTYYVGIHQSQSQPIEMAEVFVPYGDSKEIVLPDQSKVWLNAGSTLIYAKNFENMDSRSIYLIGEASFSVTKNKEKPFIVKTSKMDVEALGTVFTVKAYTDELFTTATLEEGRVKVDVDNINIESHFLNPSEQLVYSHEDGTVKLTTVDLNNFKKLRNGYLIFHKSTFQDIIATISRKYGVTFQYNSDYYQDELYNLKISSDETITEVMSILHQLIGVDYQIINKSIIIK